MLQVVTVEGGFALATVVVKQVLKGIKRVKHPSRNGKLVNHKIYKKSRTQEILGKQIWKTKRGAENALDKALNQE